MSLWVVPDSHPLSESVAPVLKVGFVKPFSLIGKSRVIESILRSLDGMDVKENLDSMCMSSVEEPLNFIVSSVSATNIWSILLESPVTNWETDDLDLSGSKICNEFFGNPGVPMCSKNLVSTLWSKSLTESPLVHTDSLVVSLSEESVEEGWGDPWFKDLPSSEVSTNGSSLS